MAKGDLILGFLLYILLLGCIFVFFCSAVCKLIIIVMRHVEACVTLSLLSLLIPLIWLSRPLTAETERRQMNFLSSFHTLSHRFHEQTANVWCWCWAPSHLVTFDPWPRQPSEPLLSAKIHTSLVWVNEHFHGRPIGHGVWWISAGDSHTYTLSQRKQMHNNSSIHQELEDGKRRRHRQEDIN